MPIINQVVKGGGGSAPEPYPLLSRVKDDSNNEIGTVCGYHTDANNQKYAVVCLDAQYRSDNGQYLSAKAQVTGLTLLGGVEMWENTDTATENCTKILNFISGTEYTSSAVTHCRSQSFVIGGITYYGQLPTIVELTDVFRHRTAINNADTSASQYSSLVIPNNKDAWSSSQQNINVSWNISYINGSTGNATKTANDFIIPVLEIPIQ